MSVQVEVRGADELRQYLRDVPPALFEAARKAYADTAQTAANRVKERIRDGAGDSLRSRTGQLRRSINYSVDGSDIGSLRASVYSAKQFASYAPTHEFGATIRAKQAYAGLEGGPYLHFPVGANLTAAGVQRMTGAEVFARGAYVARNRNAAFPYRVVLAGETMFLLTKQVTIPPRLKMRETVEDEIPTLLSELARVTGRAIDQ